MQETTTTVHYALLQAAYSMAYAGVGAFCSVFLLEKGFSNSEIGLCLCCASLFSFFVQPVTADLADRSDKISLSALLFQVLLAVSIFAGSLLLFRSKSLVLFVIYVLTIGCHGLFQPLVNSLSFRLEETGHPVNFGICRACGSLGFALAALVTGSLVNHYGTYMGPISTIVCLAITAIPLFFLSKEISTSKKGENSVSSSGSLLSFLKENRSFLFLCGGIFLFCLHMYLLNSFLTQITASLNGNAGDIGKLSSLASIVEVPMMSAFSVLNRKFKTVHLLRFSLLGFLLKALFIFLARDLSLIYLAYSTQGIGYAIFYPAMVRYIREIVPAKDIVKAQSLFTMMMTASGIVASVIGGYILDLSGVKILTATALGLSLLGTAFIFFVIAHIERKR